MKPLLPSLKEKKRYIAFQIISDSKISKKQAKEKIKKTMKKYTGLKGTAQAGLQFIDEKWNQNQQKGITRVQVEHKNNLKATFTLIDEIEDTPVTITSLGTSGILEKAHKKYITS